MFEASQGDEEEQSLRAGASASARTYPNGQEEKGAGHMKLGCCVGAWVLLLLLNVWTLWQVRIGGQTSPFAADVDKAALFDFMSTIEEYTKSSTLALQTSTAALTAIQKSSATALEKLSAMQQSSSAAVDSLEAMKRSSTSALDSLEAIRKGQPQGERAARDSLRGEGGDGEEEEQKGEESVDVDIGAWSASNDSNATNASNYSGDDEEEKTSCSDLHLNRVQWGTWGLLVNYTEDRLLLAIPETELERPFIVVASLAKVNGDAAPGFLHEVVSEEDVYFVFRPQPHKKELALSKPNWRIRQGAGNAYAESMREGWADSIGWTESIDAFLCEGENITNGSKLVKEWPPKVGEDARSNVTILMHIHPWVTSGMSSLQRSYCPGARLRSVKVFERNLQFSLVCHTDYYSEEMHFSLAFLPEEPMEIRRLDDRVGYFSSSYQQLGPVPVLGRNTASDLQKADADRTVNFITKWRLDKKDSQEKGLVEPQNPITYHIDPTVPEPLWQIVKDGILFWNEAFEEIGFKGAVKAIAPNDSDWPADYDVSDIRFSSISWVPQPDMVLAIGPSYSDPRTGEILYANIMFGEGWLRYISGDWFEQAALSTPDERNSHSRDRKPTAGAGGRSQNGHCQDDKHLKAGVHKCAESPSRRMGALHAKLVAQGSLRLGEEVPATFLKAGLRDVVCHEVGHTLGLRHNFRASAMHKPGDIHEKSKETRRIAASVMDYIAPVVAADPAKQGAFFMEGVGVYDKWAIKYGYSELQGATADERYAELLAIANEASSRPELLRGDDLDLESNDPYVVRYDLTSDPPEQCKEEVTLFKRFLSASEDFYGTDPVWNRRIEHVYDLISHQLRLLWKDCGTGMVPFIGGITFNRSNPVRLSKPVGLDVRVRALEAMCGLLADDDLVMPPLSVMQRGAYYGDEVDKWGLTTPFDDWLQTALNHRKDVLEAASSFLMLRWVDTLLWMDQQVGETSQVDSEMVAEWDLIKILLPWAGEFNAGFVLARITASILRPFFAEPAEEKKSEFQLAVQAWWIDRLVVLHIQTANATNAGGAFDGPGMFFMRFFGGGGDDEFAPFNFHGVHIAIHSIVNAIGERLVYLDKEENTKNAELRAFFSMLKRTVLPVADVSR